MVVTLFMKCPATAALNARIALRSELHMLQEKVEVTSYCEVDNYQLEMYATDDIIGEREADTMKFTQLSNKQATEYTEVLWNKALRYHRVYDEYVLKGIFIEGLPE